MSECLFFFLFTFSYSVGPFFLFYFILLQWALSVWGFMIFVPGQFSAIIPSHVAHFPSLYFALLESPSDRYVLYVSWLLNFHQWTLEDFLPGPSCPLIHPSYMFILLFKPSIKLFLNFNNYNFHIQDQYLHHGYDTPHLSDTGSSKSYVFWSFSNLEYFL